MFSVLQPACDANCNSTVGCNVQGAGFCDGECNFGYGETPSHICQGEIMNFGPHGYSVGFVNDVTEARNGNTNPREHEVKSVD